MSQKTACQEKINCMDSSGTRELKGRPKGNLTHQLQKKNHKISQKGI